MSLQNDFFTGAATTSLNEVLEVEIATAARVGVDGASVTQAGIDARGELQITLSNGVILHAGRVKGETGLNGIAHFDTIPPETHSQLLYLAAGKGTYGYFKNRYGQPVQIDRDNTLVFLFKPEGELAWEYSEFTLELKDYKKKNQLTYLSAQAPAFSHYPPAVEAVPGLYDETTGKFNLTPGKTTVTSQTEVFGEIVYTDCSHILLGFNLSYCIYLETATGRCLTMDVSTQETAYYEEAFAPAGITKKYVRVNTFQPDSLIITIEESNDGYHYTPYTTVNRGAWPGLYITYRTIGFYQPGENESKILSIGQSDRLMLEQVPLIRESASTCEVLVPSGNFAGVVRRRIHAGKPFVGKRIALYGDSITGEYGIEPGTYVNLIKRKFATNDIVHLGYTGEMLGSKTNDRSDSLTDEQQIGALTASEPDLVILQAGGSDFWAGISLGDYYGDIENATYLKTATGGLRYLLHHITKNLPVDCRLLFCTPPPGIYNQVSDLIPNTTGARMDEYIKRYRDICSEYSVPVCDFWSNAGWSRSKESLQYHFTTEGYHLSHAGYDRLTDQLLASAAKYF